MQTKIKIFSSVAVFLILTATVFCHDIKAGDSWGKERETAKKAVTAEKLEREISFLTDSICQGRASGTSGSVEAAMWIRRQFKEAGLIKMTDSWTQGFSIRHDIKGRNVIGMLPGAKSIPYDRYIIVGAHYDHLGFLDGKFYPGADSNASGVVAMTNLAEMFGKMRKMGKIFRCNIIFVAFDAKEYDLRGSQALWDMIEYERLVNPLTGKTITKDKVDLMVNIDQIGSSLAPVNKGRPDYMIMLGTSSLPKAKRNLLENCNRDESIEMDISLDYYGSTNFTNIFYKLSDQKVFVENRKPAVLFTSGITMNNNKTWDRTENLNLDVLRKRIWLMFHWLEKMI
jgi:Zn-dependent M28 family amino/carboxypeptidase